MVAEFTVCQHELFNRFRIVDPLIFGLGLAFAATGFAQLPVVPTAREPVTNVYHDVVVVDDYQWLEDAAIRRARLDPSAKRTHPRLFRQAGISRWPGTGADGAGRG